MSLATYRLPYSVGDVNVKINSIVDHLTHVNMDLAALPVVNGVC